MKAKNEMKAKIYFIFYILKNLMDGKYLCNHLEFLVLYF